MTHLKLIYTLFTLSLISTLATNHARHYTTSLALAKKSFTKENKLQNTQTILRQWLKQSKKKPWKKKSTIIVGATLLLFLIICVLIYKYKPFTNTRKNIGSRVITQANFQKALIDAVHESNRENIAILKKIRLNVTSETLNRHTFEGSTTALEYAISKRADKKILEILTDAEKASQHTIEVTQKAFQSAILATIPLNQNDHFHQESTYLLELLLLHLSASIVNQKIATLKDTMHHEQTPLDYAIKHLYDGVVRVLGPHNAF